MSEIKLGSVVQIVAGSCETGLFTPGGNYTVIHEKRFDGSIFLVVEADDGVTWLAVGGLHTFCLPPGAGILPTSDVFTDQLNFMRSMGQSVEGFNAEQTALYLRLTSEEFCETLCAANPSAHLEIKALFSLLEQHIKVADDADVVELFDGVLDVVVVAAGTGVSAGFPLQAGWDEVMRTNFAKVDPATGAVRRRADGKVLKPEGWTPPNLADLLAK